MRLTAEEQSIRSEAHESYTNRKTMIQKLINELILNAKLTDKWKLRDALASAY